MQDLQRNGDSTSCTWLFGGREEGSNGGGGIQNFGVRKSMNGFKYVSGLFRWNYWPVCSCGDITDNSKVTERNVCKSKAGYGSLVGHNLLWMCLIGGKVMVINCQERNCREVSTGQGVCNNVFLASDVTHISGELSYEEEMSCLPWWLLSRTGEGECQWLMVSVDCESSSFNKMREVLDGEVDSQKFADKGTVFFSALESLWEKKAIGGQMLAWNCSYWPPTTLSAASSVMLVLALMWGWCRSVAEVRVDLANSNASWHSCVQVMVVPWLLSPHARSVAVQLVVALSAGRS